VKIITLSKGYVVKVSDKDYKACLLAGPWHSTGKFKENTTVYARRIVIRKNIKTSQLLHRFILGLTDPAIQVDHKDGDGLNCTRSNLRIATQSQNQHNKFQKNNTSGHKGVYWHEASGKWQASIKVDKTTLHLGTFASREEAARARFAADLKYLGDFSYQESRT